MLIKEYIRGKLKKRSSFMMIFLISAALLNGYGQGAKEKGVRLVRSDEKERVDIYINGSFFTSYRYPSGFEKPFLFPVMAPNGSVITRGYPIEPRKGERVDHPHHTGIWFNYGNVNGLDFWNNSSAIAAEKKDGYGHIVNKRIVKAEGGSKGLLEVEMNWDDNKGNTLLQEHTKYIFSGEGDSWTIDHVSTLTAVNGQVILGESKEGMLAIRVDRAFEMPSNESLIFTDDKGNPTTVPSSNNDGVTGMYTSGRGLKGDAVWGTRNDWVVLSGIKDGIKISFGIFDNPKNPGYPAYAHARGYGLFALNNLGRNSYDPKQDKTSTTLEKGQSITLIHRFCIRAGSEITAEEANKLFSEFSKTYYCL